MCVIFGVLYKHMYCVFFRLRQTKLFVEIVKIFLCLFVLSYMYLLKVNKILTIPTSKSLSSFKSLLADN